LLLVTIAKPESLRLTRPATEDEGDPGQGGNGRPDR